MNSEERERWDTYYRARYPVRVESPLLRDGGQRPEHLRKTLPSLNFARLPYPTYAAWYFLSEADADLARPVLG